MNKKDLGGIGVSLGIGGVVGVGKSSLAEELHRRHGGIYVKESVENNPFMEKFYSNMKRWAAQMQYFMLGERLKAYMKIEGGKWNIYDQLLEVDAGVFAYANFLDGNMTEDEYEVYLAQNELWQKSIVKKEPDIKIMLLTDDKTMIKHIKKRGRKSEQGDMSYFKRLNKLCNQVAEENPDIIKIYVTEDTTVEETADKVEAIVEEFYSSRTTKTIKRIKGWFSRK